MSSFYSLPQPTQPNATTHVGVQAGSDKQSLPDKIGTLQIQSLHEVHWPFITLTSKAHNTEEWTEFCYIYF